MTVAIKDNNLFDVYKNYFNYDHFNLNCFAGIKRSQIFSS